MSSCEACGASPAELQCPKCKEVGLPPSLFCSQNCFKKAWAQHKEKHSMAAPCSIKTMNDTAKVSFNFTGPLRPGLITPRRFVPPTIVRPDYALNKDGTSIAEQKSYSNNKPIKHTSEQIERIRVTARHTRDVLDVAIRATVPGATTDSIDAAVHEAFVARGVYPSTLGYMKFPKSCCTSINEVICHGIPDSTVLQEGDIVNLDVSGYFNGVHGDCNETVFVGKPSAETAKLVHNTYLCTMAGIAMCRPGAMYKHIGDTIAPIAESEGFGVVRSVCGHGIGELFHCPPNVSHYANNKAVGQMAANHVFTIEPMINAGTWKDVCWPDDWTMTTVDGKRSAQFEHMVLVTPSGHEVLTLSNSWDKPYYQVQLEEWGMPLPGAEKQQDAVPSTVAAAVTPEPTEAPAE